MNRLLVLAILLLASHGGLCFNSVRDGSGRSQYRLKLARGSRSQANQVDQNETEPSAFQTLVENLVETVIASDKKRDTKGQDGASTGWTSWVDEAAALKLSDAVAAICFDATTVPSKRWKRWLLSSPSPVIVEYSRFLMKEVDAYLKVIEIAKVNGAQAAQLINQEDPTDAPDKTPQHSLIAQRLGMRLFYLPSGETFETKLQAPPGAMIYGVALHGGVKRFRCIGTNRRAGERVVIVSNKDHTEEVSWMQYGGPERSYEAIDIGPCLFMEVLLYPDGLEVDLLREDNTGDILVSSPSWQPHQFLSYRSTVAVVSPMENLAEDSSAFDTSAFKDRIKLSVGGLQTQIDQVVRRVVDGRAYQGSEKSDMSFLYTLGLSPIRGLLLYGPPGWYGILNVGAH